jgi:hypothetical protein
VPYVGFFRNELVDDFYFFNPFTKKIYKLPKIADISSLQKNEHEGKIKYLVKLDNTIPIWEDKEVVALPDKPYRDMTLREYACIHLKIADSGNTWLDVLIAESKSRED